MRAEPCNRTDTRYAPETYAGDAILALYQGLAPHPPLTFDQERALIRSGFIEIRRDVAALTEKGEDLALDVIAELGWQGKIDFVVECE